MHDPGAPGAFIAVETEWRPQSGAKSRQAVSLLRELVRGIGEKVMADSADNDVEGAQLDPLFRLPDNGIDLEEVERQLVVQALERCAWNQTRAAALLGLNRDQVRYRIRKFALTGCMPRTTLSISPTR
jgi:DNA-binding protein Fis